MGLLLADLQSVLNSVRGRDGHGALLGRVVPPLLLGAMYWFLGSTLLENPGLLRALHRSGDSLTILFATALSPCPVVAGWVGFAHVHRQLFEAPELALWQAAPIARGRAAVQIMLRASGTALLWAGALALPFLLQMLASAGAPPAAYGIALLALLAALLPALCLALGLQIVLLRFAGNRHTRALMSIASAFAAFGFPIFLLMEVFAGTGARATALAQAANDGQAPSPLVAAGASLLAHAVRRTADLAAMLPLLTLLAATLLAFLLVAPLHAIAVQNHQLAYRPRKWLRGRWPAPPAAAIRKKEFVQVLQQPGALLHMLLVGAMVYAFAGQRVFVGVILDAGHMPLLVRQCAAMAALWFLAVLMLLYAHMGRLAIWDGPQWPLYLKAPLRPATLLLPKLATIGLLLCWPAAVAALAGVQWFGAGWLAVLAFLGFAAAGTLAALASIAMVGTWPWLVRAELDGKLSQGSRGLVGSLLLVLTFYTAVSPGFFAWVWLHDRAQRHAFGGPPVETGMLLTGCGAALGIGLLQLLFAGWLASRNYRRLLAPR